MTNSSGNVVQLYEYSVYGQVAASDENHPNRFMFTGREFDKDTGLYYYRARYYNPEIGRFLQTDPIGYGDGMNVYAYCRNGQVINTDPTGLFRLIIEAGTVDDALAVAASMQRVRARCLEVIAQIDMFIPCMGCNQDHRPEDCPMIADLQWLKDILSKIVVGIESDEPLAIRMMLSDGEWGGAYLGADMECWHPDFEGEPGTTYPTIWYNEEFYDGDREFDELDWDETTLHELCHYCGVPDPIEPGSEYVTNFYNPYAIMVLVKVNLWGTNTTAL